MVRIRCAGVWQEGSVRTTWRENSRRIVDEVEREIELAWQRAASRPGVLLFDGPMCRLESLAVRDDSLELGLSRGSYKTFVGTNLNNAARMIERYGADVMANPVGLSCALVTADEYLMLGRRNARVAYHPSRVHPFAGALEPGQAAAPDVFAEVRRELHEELGFELHDLQSLRCLGMVEDAELMQPELCFVAATQHTRLQIQDRTHGEEHVAAWSVPAEADEVAGALASDEVFTPVAVGCILLWGRVQFGQAWFDRLVGVYSSSVPICR